MTIMALTKKSIDRLKKELEKEKDLLRYYTDSKPWKIWLDELDEFAVEYKKYLKKNPINQKFESFVPKGKK